MLAGIYNIFCEQGSTFVRVFDIETPDTNTPPTWTPLDLTGYTAKMHIRRLINDASEMLELSTENGSITLQGNLGRIAIMITAEQTASLTSSGVYDLEIIGPSGTPVERVLKGQFTLDPEVTR